MNTFSRPESILPHPSQSKLSMYASSTPLYSPVRPIISDGSRSPNLASPNLATFEVEHVSRPPSAMGNRPPLESTLDAEFIYRDHVSKLISAKSRPFSVSGRIPLDPSHLVLFFRSKTGITHSLDFPIDIDYSTPPALDVLIAACKRTSIPGYDSSTYEAFHYPSNLPLTPSLEIANHPILDAIRNMLFPTLPIGHYLTVRRERLDVLLAGSRMPTQQGQRRTDNRIATLSITLPVRFRGGALVIRDSPEHGGAIERLDTAAPTSDLEWTAFLGECEHEVEPVTKGCRMSLSYAVFSKSFGAGTGVGGIGLGAGMELLFTPNQPFLDLFPPVLQMSRGRKIAFLLAHDYDVDPSVLLAESLVPFLKGGDAMLYHALKLFKLAPVLHWTAGGYIWPIDRPVEIFDAPASPRMSSPPMHGAFSNSPRMPRPSSAGPGPGDALRLRVESSGAVPLADADVHLLTDWRAPPENTSVGKARVHFVSEGMLERLVVNVMLVAFVL
ncbi:hypothetical protein MSAN_01618400 [Mycena sanguinolenta]|uniref:Fe2OG dioxygenase domain-containing protein n=1 Tax=Mycena sanguinolenta TaxID=230812 RepID=A0A8H6Y266_9AGAR|nr:hypothetical protein MSAN_01618400 [Mycena sanguinolenta]